MCTETDRHAVQLSWCVWTLFLTSVLVLCCACEAAGPGQPGGRSTGTQKEAVRSSGSSQPAATADTSVTRSSTRREQATSEPDPFALDEETRQVLWSSPEDPPTEYLDGVTAAAAGRHYLAGDEWNLELFQPYLARLGGGYMGVGTDQGYLFIGWVKPEVAWLVDYDPWVVAVHRVYGELFERAETIDEMIEWWSPAREEDVRRIIVDNWQGRQQELTLSAYDAARRRQYARLSRMKEEHRRDHVISWMSDPATYRWVRRFVLAGRARPLLGNLLDDEAIRGIGDAARDLGVPIRAVYLSNAEEYWKYEDTFRENMKSLYTDERSVLMRTIASTPQNNDYHYFLQPWPNYLEWMDETRIQHVYYVAHRDRIEGPDHYPFQVITQPPEYGLERMREHRERDRENSAE